MEVYKQSRFVTANFTYDKKLVVNSGDREIQLLYLGRGHTRGDTVVFLPKEKVVITGDLVNNRLPVFRDGHPSEWQGTLESIQRLAWDFLIPGHGPVERGRGHILQLIGYIRDLNNGAKDAVAKGLTAEQFAQSMDLTKYRPEFPPSFETYNAVAVQRAFAEASGRVPKD